MDHIIVHVTRVVACFPRLRILSALAPAGEITPSDLARQLDTGIDSVCVHLKHLSSAGLIQRRHSGIWCYGVASSPYADQTFSGKVARWLYSILKDPVQTLNDFEVDQLRNLSATQAQTQLHAFVFEAATAFGNLRRLKILRYLAAHGPATADDLSKKLSMSLPAVWRHVDKLTRRGYVEAESVGGSSRYRLTSKAKTPVHQKLLEFVTAEWKKR